MKIIEIEEAGDLLEPGICTVTDSPRWGFKPMEANGLECVPYQWGRDFPEIEGFMARFPLHWKNDDVMEAWYGTTYDPDATYWARR